MQRIAIIQARMTSSRLPGKVLMDVGSRPMLAQQLRRLRRCQCIDGIIIATTANKADEPLVALARQETVECHRGSENDVLTRFVGAAKQTQAGVVVRLTADCPLVDPEIIDRIIRELIDHSTECDYASNVLKRTYPRGLDAEAFFADTLLRMDRLALSPAAREHVTLVPRIDRPELFLCRSVEDVQNNADLRWTVDTAADLDFVRRLYKALDLENQHLSYASMVAYVRTHPELLRLDNGTETWDPSLLTPS